MGQFFEQLYVCELMDIQYEETNDVLLSINFVQVFFDKPLGFKVVHTVPDAIEASMEVEEENESADGECEGCDVR